MQWNKHVWSLFLHIVYNKKKIQVFVMNMAFISSHEAKNIYFICTVFSHSVLTPNFLIFSIFTREIFHSQKSFFVCYILMKGTYCQVNNKWKSYTSYLFHFMREKISLAIRPLIKYNWVATWDFQQCGMCDQQSLRSAYTYSKSDQSLC